MRILHVMPTYYPATYWGGPIHSVYSLNEALATLTGVELRVLTTDAAGPRRSERLAVRVDEPKKYSPGHEVHFCRRIALSAVSLQLLMRLFISIKWADVVHLTGTYSFPTLPTLAICRLTKKSLIWSPRGALQASHEWSMAGRPFLKRVWDSLSNKLISPGGVVLHVTSEQERIASLARIPNARAVVIPNGVTLPPSPVKTWCPGGALRLMFMGRLDPKKGIENLLRALDHLRDPSITLKVFGTGEDRYVRTLVALTEKLSLSNQVTFVGHVDGEDKDRAFAQADLCVVPSHSENFCMVVAEALAYGIPVIASTGTPWEAISQKNCGAWVDNSPGSLANAIRELRNMPLHVLGRQGREWMSSDFTWSAAAKRMHELYLRSCL